MFEFTLPIVDASLLPADTFAHMAEANTSGVAVRSGTEVRLLHYEAILDGFRRGKTTLMQIEDFHQVLVVAGISPSEVGKRLSSAKREVGSLSFRENFIDLISHNSGLAALYLHGPKTKRCSNTPPQGHYYPPLEADKSTPKNCIACDGVLP
jgi:hypothetical protein